MQTLMLCDWLPPDFGAVGQYQLARARELASQGHGVTLVGFNSERASTQRQSVGSGTLMIQRLYRPTYQKTSFIRRAFWTLGANVALLWGSRAEFRAADEILFTGSPPYLLHFVMPLASLLRKRTCYRITDFHPEALIASLGRTPPWLRALRALTWFWRRRVSRFEVLGEDQRKILAANGIPPERIELRRDGSPVQFTGNERADRRPASLAGRFTILYSGNWGVAHDAGTLINALQDCPPELRARLGLWINATGTRIEEVTRGLNGIAGLQWTRTPPCRIEELPAVLLSADAHLITLSDAFVGYVLPSKVYACIASGKPVIFVGSEHSDVDLLCRTQLPSSRYFRVACGDVAGLRTALSRLVHAVSPS